MNNLSDFTYAKTKEVLMRKNNYYPIICIVLLLAAVTVILWGCKDDSDTGYTHYTPEDFVNLDNFTLVTNAKPDTVIRYDKKGETVNYSTTYTGASYTNTVFYVLGKDKGKEFSEGVWKDITSSDIGNYLNTINNACGLIYNKLDLSQFKEIANKKLSFSIDSFSFFKQAYRQIYQTYFGTDYQEDEFVADFEKNAQTLFGDFKDYDVTLDCSEKDKMVLSIVNEKQKNSNVFEYSQIGSTTVDLPE